MTLHTGKNRIVALMTRAHVLVLYPTALLIATLIAASSPADTHRLADDRESAPHRPGSTPRLQYPRSQNPRLQHIARTEAPRSRMEPTPAEARLRKSLDRLRARQEAFLARMERRVAALEARSETRLRELALRMEDAHGELERNSGSRLNAAWDKLVRQLREEYSGLQKEETARMEALTSRLDTLQQERSRFKETFLRNRNSILFIRTDYQVRFLPTEEVRDLTAFGTGFFISPEGVGMTARHVIHPWRFSRQLRALETLGLAEVLPESLRVTMWPTEAQVTDPNVEGGPYHTDNGYRTNGRRPDIHILYTAPLEEAVEQVALPLGLVDVSIPKLGGSDLLVFQVLDFSRRFSYVRLADGTEPVSPLDEIMVLGYPLSRLANGMAMPQPSRGRVRHVGRDFLELDSPMHPGNSGGPILNRRGQAVGLASAILDSPVYGVAVNGEDLRAAWTKVKSAVREEQARLKALGCDPGPLDGIPGRKTWQARACETEPFGADAGHAVSP